jgi:hypothetical protein
MSCPSDPPWFDNHQNNTQWTIQIVMLPIAKFSLAPCRLLLLSRCETRKTKRFKMNGSNLSPYLTARNLFVNLIRRLIYHCRSKIS